MNEADLPDEPVTTRMPRRTSLVDIDIVVNQA